MSSVRIPFIDPLLWRRIIAVLLVIMPLAFCGYARAATTIFLPLVIRYEPLLQNGDFETVPNVSWKEENSYSYALILDGTNLLEGITPQGGSRAVWLLGDYDETSTLSQTFFVPLNADSLVYHYWIRSDETLDYCGVDQAYVRLAGDIVATYDLCEPKNTGTWVEERIALSSYRGQIVELVLGGSTDADVYSDFFLDTVFITTVSGN